MFEYRQIPTTTAYEKSYERIFNMMHKGKKGMCKGSSTKKKGDKKSKKKK